MANPAELPIAIGMDLPVFFFASFFCANKRKKRKRLCQANRHKENEKVNAVRQSNPE
jgi:hypothetical protein